MIDLVNNQASKSAAQLLWGEPEGNIDIKIEKNEELLMNSGN
jgi:hypothetical protein